MKDYMIALNDDKEVLKVLVKRIGERLKDLFEKQVRDKKQGIEWNQKHKSKLLLFIKSGSISTDNYFFLLIINWLYWSLIGRFKITYLNTFLD